MAGDTSSSGDAAASFQDALIGRGGGVAIPIEVITGSKRDQFPAGYNSWRRAILCRVSARPKAGKANRMIILLIASFFGVPERDVSIIRGQRSSRKVVFVSGISLDDAVQKIGDSIPE
ncbi:MAG: DUF167 domain-containing protein [Methanoculleaceae archaeon]